MASKPLADPKRSNARPKSKRTPPSTQPRAVPAAGTNSVPNNARNTKTKKTSVTSNPDRKRSDARPKTEQTTPPTQTRAAPAAGNNSVLNNARNTKIKNSSFVINTTNLDRASVSNPTLEELYQRFAPNAVLNEGGRADNAKCQPGTRKKVILQTEKWMNSLESDRILWLSGPAGGGKTAIMKTIAEQSMNQVVRTVNFFFFRGDTTRNSAHPVIPTLLYQLFQLYPASLSAITKDLSRDSRILDKSIAQQCKLLSTLASVIQRSTPAGARIILLIDGLDECDVNAERSQKDILHALNALVHENDSPFRLLVASRLEARIQMAFNQLPSQPQTMFLDDEYSPETDIRQFVETEFREIKRSHPSARSLPLEWPSDLDVEGIVTNSSGQFLYAATVMRYISHASTVPSLSLKRVQGIVPAAKNSPFTHLDSIYIFILSQVDDLEATCDMLSMTFVKKGFIVGPSVKELLSYYHPRYDQDLVDSCASELSSIIKLTEDGDIEFYHASLPDFLMDQARSGRNWIDINAFRTKLLVKLWGKVKVDSGLPYDSESLQAFLFSRLTNSTPDITHMLLNDPFPYWVTEVEADQARVLRAIYRLYYKDDIMTYKRILRRVIGAIFSNKAHSDVVDVPHAKEYLILYQKWNWWFKLLQTIRRKK
ncbi:hypothetical protein D9619_011259 [Psilocybe cf. subviscida]|uniref:NACHT domain-containing protein n=1 Tax=Psilocybe cf. subviscida TaxID=2480587 RepID=A0A8H5BJ64_9AGAR|nr:hypothetical protein D9619_011259 [Psilocybe cf. subviscida]